MTQRNVSTGWERSVRCVADTPSITPASPDTPSLTPASPGGKWAWQDEHGGWNPYTPAVQRLLGACQLCGVGQWEVEAAGRCYKVEIGRGTAGLGQQTNMDTGVQRAVRYSEGDRVGAAKEEGKASLWRKVCPVL